MTRHADNQVMRRFDADSARPAQLVESIVALASQSTTLAVDAAIAAARAEAAGHLETVGDHAARLALGAAVAIRELTWQAQALEATTARDAVLVPAGVAITGLQASLLAIAAAIQGVADAGGPRGVAAAADTLRTAALELDELLPAYQPAP